jgi:glycosyltransferase involved in cell wall biosynthesis
MTHDSDGRLKIAYITTYDPKDVRCWSGLGYFIWLALAQAGVDVQFVGPISLPSNATRVLKVKQFLYGKILRKLYLPEHDVFMARAYSREAWKILSKLKGVQAVVSPGSIPVAYLPGTVPLLTISDVTHKLLFEAYHIYENLCAANHRDGDRIENASLKRAAASVFASDWAAASAIRDYGAKAEKVHVVPFGANLEVKPDRNEIISAIDARGFGKIQLMFIGVDWVRKGGQVALEVVRELIKRGFPTHLTVIGCDPCIPPEDAGNVTVRGFIKKTAEGQKEINGLLSKSHFLIVPSEAECYGLVYCEASAFGVPSIARNVGGVSTIIKNEINGRLFELQDTASEIVDWVAGYLQDRVNYRRLAHSSMAEYDSRLNWVIAGGKLKMILKDIINNSGTAPIRIKDDE